MRLQKFRSLLAVLSTSILLPPSVLGINTTSPTVTVTNGSYIGKYVPEWQQDQFLGIPYAIPPLGDLRFARPKSLNTSFTGYRDATHYGYSCYQYGTTFNLSEDCLTLNVIRPAGTTPDSNLPVLIWIFGGGFYTGATADPQYNLSGITHVGQQTGQSIITVSMDYRLGVWGFLQTPQVLAEGGSNAGLLDQRLALRWIKENIASFGGDPRRITVWGESAGGQSISYHLYSYDGRDDDLFQAAIIESGSPTGASLNPLGYYTVPTENLTRATGCWTSTNKLACLRSLTSDQLWKAQVDGDFLTDYPSSLTPQGKFIKIPLLIGANSDEGTSFGVAGLDNETAIFNNLLVYRASNAYALSPPTARKLLELYPNDPANEPPHYITNATIFPSKGLQWRRSAAIAGDLVMISGRRKLCEIYAAASQSVYSYRFDTFLWNAAVTDGAKHFVNVVFSFQNISGALGPLPQYQSYLDLSKNIGKAYISFVNYHDPNLLSNSSLSTISNGTSINPNLPYWPLYNKDAPKNMVLNSNKTFIEDDTWRKEGIDFINWGGVDRELWS
ncbi:putative carboxylesterase family protein [Botrytis fragariae]|uniref:Carboxylic ester hydrolase n=1 Tax=Botrytis fragariae TaxID=1964551 RepID=A0A8H6ARN1_9HELO|nr:putative carboxylesterase family protein [Botrytis fragariae]KAF5872377.1 putative carboxylesterase family protein [Botrytis fragariae]